MNVFLKHGRYSNSGLINDKNPKGLSSRGGVTVAVLNRGTWFTWGISKCHLSDVFSKKLGVIRAVGRAKRKLALKTEPMAIDVLRLLVEDFTTAMINHGIMPDNQDDFEYFIDQIQRGIGIPLKKEAPHG